MVSHKNIIAGLKVVTKASVLSMDPEAFHAGMQGESERSIMVIAAGVVEQGLREKVMHAFPGLLNSEEKERLNGPNGPLYSFSNVIVVAQALGIVNREQRRKIEVVKAVRNTCAHATTPVGFRTPAIFSAFCFLLGPKSQPVLEKLPADRLKFGYMIGCMLLMSEVVFKPGSLHPALNMDGLLAMLAAQGPLPASR